MNLGLARRVASHAAVGFAFASMALGGELPLVAIVLFSVAFLLSLFFEGRLGRPALHLILSVGAFAFLLVAWLAGAFDLIVAASLFAATLCANRMLSRRSTAEDGLLHLSALMMLAGGAALSAELAYGLCFAGFAVAMCSALTLSFLEEAAAVGGASRAERERLASGKLLGALSLLSIAGLAGAVIIFFTFPRVTMGFYSRERRGARSAVVGFSEVVNLEGTGALKSDGRPVARVRLLQEDKGEALSLYWRGKSLDLFDGRSFTSTAQESGGGMAAVHLPPPVGQGAEPGRAQRRVEVEVLPEAGTAALFLPGEVEELGPVFPISGDRRRRQRLPIAANGRGDYRLAERPVEGFTYRLAFSPHLAGEALAGRGSDYGEEERRLYLQLPEGLDPRVGELAKRLTRGMTEPLEKVRAIGEALLSDYSYSLELPGPTTDPLATFLFERRSGHCEFFATAFTVLARAAGVPARNATGFFGGVRPPGGDYYLLRAGDAHAWTEVLFPGVGFVPFDATPPAGRAASMSELSILLSSLADRATTWWRLNVVDLTLWDQWRAARGAFESVSTGFERLRPRAGQGVKPLLILLLALALGALLVFTLRALARWRSRGVRKRGEAGGPARSPRLREAFALYRSLSRALERARLGRGAGQTQRAHARALLGHRCPAAEQIAEVTEWYLSVRFGERAVAALELARMRRLVAEAKRALRGGRASGLPLRAEGK